MIYAFAGSNWFSLRQEVDSLTNNFMAKNGSLNIEKFDCADKEKSELIASIQSVSLFSEQKLIIVENLFIYKEITEDLNKFLDSIDDTVTFVIVEKTIDKRSSYYKNLKKLPNFKEFNELEGISLENWIKKYVSTKGGDITGSNTRLLIDRVGTNQTFIERELTKLLAYNKDISKQNIELLTDQTPNSKIFDLVDNVFAGREGKALEIYDDQRAQSVEPQAILGMLIWQMHLVATCVATNKSTAEIASSTGLNAFTLGKASKIADRMGKAKVNYFIDLLADIELSSKTKTYNLDDALKLAIVSLKN